MFDLDAKLTAAAAAAAVGVSKQLFNYWRTHGKICPVGRRGRSQLYRFGDALAVEAGTRRTPQSHRVA